MTTMTAFDDMESCRETAEARGQVLNQDWHPTSSHCLGFGQMDQEQLEMFEKKTLGQPYLVFSDGNDFQNVVFFAHVPPVMIDAMLWKWQSELKKQGMKDVVIVMDPQRKKIMDLVEKVKASLSKHPEREADVAAVVTAAATEPEARVVRTALAKYDSLLLSNGQTVTGQILERRPDGIWFRVDEGVDMLFSYGEIKQVLGNSSDQKT